MRRLAFAFLVISGLVLASSCRPAATAPKPTNVKPSKLECRGGWTISLGGKDSVYTGC